MVQRRENKLQQLKIQKPSQGADCSEIQILIQIESYFSYLNLLDSNSDLQRGSPACNHCSNEPFEPLNIIWLENNWHRGGSRGGSRGEPRGPSPPPWPPKMRPQHQNSTKLRPQNGSFRPVTIWAPPWSNAGSAPVACVKSTKIYQFIHKFSNQGCTDGIRRPWNKEDKSNCCSIKSKLKCKIKFPLHMHVHNNSNFLSHPLLSNLNGAFCESCYVFHKDLQHFKHRYRQPCPVHGWSRKGLWWMTTFQ